ncbi:GNAT family N-acetyltransferase [Candidatus Cetobacterium colombiensis]|uniref:GNAT family N-acetyltransferase n=1 Tax=Candidatus Cetobacterium colombiensis TaxID=3073100 RepID=A0ABU4WCT3_9FUSO|nr:GNAT family N-acetyltransferase [Candidatus Cetobacterium colombiensis]MDX8337331.1 GNAT family N-acetyltransferase [Candidatus Cetobacterium colombiensis]
MVHLGTKELYSDRLILRKLRELDAEMMFNNWCTDSDVTKYLRWLPHKNIDITKSLLKNWVNNYESDKNYLWGIELKENGQLIGTIAVVDLDKFEIGYALSKNMWGKGIMTEALDRVIKFFFEEVGAEKIVSWHDILNPASGKVMLKVGMRYIGNEKNYYINPFGEKIEVAKYEIIKK